MDNITHEMRLNNWTEICKQCQARPTGMTVESWCKENNIKIKTYYYWQRKVRQEVYKQMKDNLPALSEPQPVAFAELPYRVTTTSATESYKPDAVIKKGSLSIEISNSVSDELLSRLLGVMAHA